MGVLFIAAGTSSDNRLYTLDQAHGREELGQLLRPRPRSQLEASFSDSDSVFVWGAGRPGALKRIRPGEYVVDLKNQEVVQVFRYCFDVDTESDTSLQDYLGWDSGKRSTEQRRSYRYVYFLRDPMKTTRAEKSFFLRAFGLESKPHSFDAQRYLDDEHIRHALHKTRCDSVEEFLGISMESPAAGSTESIVREVQRAHVVAEETPPHRAEVELPGGLDSIIERVRLLHKDSEHLERDHEALVEKLFEWLGYRSVSDIKFRRGNIDIRIDFDGTPLVTIEVKADWALSASSVSAIQQAYGYALESGTRHVIISNGDRYAVFDRIKGLTRDDNLVGEFELSDLTGEGLGLLESLRASRLPMAGRE